MSQITILAVDDNPTNLKLVQEVLSFEGYRVLTATDANEALRILQTESVEVVLMDIAMPGMDGLELTRVLKSDPATRHLVIIALTAFAMKGDETKARAVGCDGYITKPVDTRRLPEQVASVLAAHRATHPA